MYVLGFALEQYKAVLELGLISEGNWRLSIVYSAESLKLCALCQHSRVDSVEICVFQAMALLTYLHI